VKTVTADLVSQLFILDITFYCTVVMLLCN